MSKLNAEQLELDVPSPLLRSKAGLILIPTPTADPDDPLNWSSARKARLLAVLCLAAYAANASALAGQLAYPIQAEVYGKTIIESSYSVSAAISGLAAGALVFIPFARIFGRLSITFWSLLGSLGCAVWSAQLTQRGDYVRFIVSRLLSGMFGSIPSAVGGGIILDMFFLHDRGKAFLCYEVSILLGSTSGPTFSGFIINSQSWTVCFWWTVPLLAISAAAILFLAEETGYDRQRCAMPVSISRKYIANRVATFFPGTAMTIKSSARDFGRTAAIPFLIALSPATVLIGVFTLVIFGWVLLNDILSPLFLQTPRKEGGYGFSPIQNAAFSFSLWFGNFGAQALGYFINDSLPLWVCKHYYRGTWKPELRLYCMAISAVVVPIGLGICGAGLQYHLHFIVYAFGIFVVNAGALVSVPVATNYIAESYTHNGMESTLVMTFYRLSWGVAIPFFITLWIGKVGVGWVFGTAAFLTIGAWTLVIFVIWRGTALREWPLMRIEGLVSSEAGARVFEDQSGRVAELVGRS